MKPKRMTFKNNFMKMIETIREEMRKSLKEKEEKENKNPRNGGKDKPKLL